MKKENDIRDRLKKKGEVVGSTVGASMTKSQLIDWIESYSNK